MAASLGFVDRRSHKPLAPHLNPAIDAHMRFRLSLQVSNVRRLIESPRNVWMTAHLPEEVRRFREKYPYGWQVAGTTLSNLFRELGIDWDDEDEEKVSAGHTRTLTRSADSFWREWLRGPVPAVMRPVHQLEARPPAAPTAEPQAQLPTDLRALIMSFVPPLPKPMPEAPFDVELKHSPWWQDPRMYGDF